MALKLFLTYFGIFFASAIASVVFAKQMCETFAAAGKKPIIISILMALLVAVIAFGVCAVIDNLFLAYWILAIVGLGFGIFQATYVHNKYFYQATLVQGEEFGGEMLFSFAVIAFTTVFFAILEYFFKDKSFLFYPMAFSGLGFFVPLLLIHTFNAAYSIPGANFPTWVYPSSPLDLPDEGGIGKLLVIGFEIAKKQADIKKTYFRAKAPENMVLGDLYYHFINDYNELQSETPIQYTDSNNESHEWWFHVKPKWYQRSRMLDPEMTIKANKIKENTVIICERITIT